MSDHAYADWLTETDLQAMLAAPPTPFVQMILEAIDSVVLAHFQNPIDLRRYDSGRAFGATCELRWQRDGNAFHTLLVGSLARSSLSQQAHHQALPRADFKYHKRQYYLWGEWRDQQDATQTWVEARIPHIFDYPDPPDKGRWRRKLSTMEYVHRRTGDMAFYRFMDITPERL